MIIISSRVAALLAIDRVIRDYVALHTLPPVRVFCKAVPYYLFTARIAKNGVRNTVTRK
jgi:hypothetical protein